jgi:hypothetical protein
MTATAIVMAVETTLAYWQASRLAALQLQTVIESGHAIQANSFLRLREAVVSFGDPSLDAAHAAISHQDLRSIIRANLENEHGEC